MTKKPKTISDINRTKYLLPPTWDQIEEFINELGVTATQFERFYNIPFNTLTQIKAGNKILPANSWHFIYERIKPAYGIGFLKDYSGKEVTPNPITAIPSPEQSITHDDKHGRLGNIK